MMEHYIGVDLHQAFFQACAVDQSGARRGKIGSPDGRGHHGVCGAVRGLHSGRRGRARRRGTSRSDRAHVGELRIVDSVDATQPAMRRTDRWSAPTRERTARRVSAYHPPVAIGMRELCRAGTRWSERTRILSAYAPAVRRGSSARRLVDRSRLDTLGTAARRPAATLRRTLAAGVAIGRRSRGRRSPPPIRSEAAADPGIGAGSRAHPRRDR